MPFSIACPCGRTYTKPDHKAGTCFRCHMCGRELTVSEGSAAQGIVLAPQNEHQAVKPPWDTETATAADADSLSPARPSILRTTLAWVLIFLGLAGVVGGLGQIYLYSIIEKARIEDANAQARLFGEFQTLGRASNNDAWIVYTIAICGIGLGLVFSYTGFRIRKVEGNNKMRKKRRAKKARLPTDSG